jgi:CBS domain containing-hemolysin-like protein
MCPGLVNMFSLRRAFNDMDEPASSFSNFFFLSGAVTLSGTLLKLFSVFILVIANGFFVAAEFALVGVRRSRIEMLARAGNRSAVRLMDLLQHLSAYISATQLGITLSSLGLGWLGEPAVSTLVEIPLLRFADWSGLGFLASETARHTISFALAFAIITALHIVLGELAPKTLALERAEKVALAVALPLRLFYRFFYWPIRFLDWAGTRTVRIFGLHSTAEHASIYTEEELRQLIDLSHQSGHLRKEERRLINRVFEFSETQVREAMVPRTEVAAIPETYTLQQIAQAFKENGYSRLPVYGESLDDVKGFVHSKDVMPYLLQPDTFKLREVIKPALFIVDTARLEDVLRRMQRDKGHFGFVVDEHGGIEGILTLEDLLEEIVGDISDEHDEEVNEQITKLTDGTYLLDGGLVVRDCNRRLDLDLPESDAYTTIAGFLMDTAGRVLEKGEIVSYNDLRFCIEEVERRRIRRVRLEHIVSEESAEAATMSV